MKTLTLSFALLYCSFAPAAETFVENFNFGILDQNLVAAVDQYFSYTVTTNANGNLVFQKFIPSPVPPPTSIGEARVILLLKQRAILQLALLPVQPPEAWGCKW